MQKQGILISMKRPGVWKVGSPNYYTRFTDWLPDVNLNKITRNEAMIQLIKSYIQSYGPVTEKDISWWTGFKVNRVRNLLESLKHELIECEISGLESKFMMLKSDFNCFKQFKPIKRYSISLLPYEDSYVKGYIERERLVSSELHDNAYNYGEARPTILLNGQIVGTWKLRSKQDELTFHLFQTIEKPLLNRSYLKAKAIGRFVCGKEVRITEQ